MNTQFLDFVDAFRDTDPVLVEAIIDGYNVCMEGWLGKTAATAALVGMTLAGGAHAKDKHTTNRNHVNKEYSTQHGKAKLTVGNFSIMDLTPEQRNKYNDRSMELMQQMLEQKPNMDEMIAMRMAESQARQEVLSGELFK